MTGRPRFHLVDIVAHDYEATLAFYRRLGAEVEDGLPGDIRHAHIHYDGVDVHIDNPRLGDIYVLCSDGLSGMVKDHEISQVADAEIDLDNACERLIGMANKNGGLDNITVVVIRVETL